MKRLLSLVFASIFIYGCGGGGSAGEVEPSPESIDITQLTRPSPGSSFSSNFSGTFEVAGGRSTRLIGNISVSVETSLTTFDGEPVYASVISLAIRSEATGEIINAEATDFSTTDGRYVGSLIEGLVLCTVSETNLLPTDITGNDSGLAYQESCTDGESSTVRWRTEISGSNGRLIFTESSSNPTSTSSTETIYTFDSMGVLIRYAEATTVTEDGETANIFVSGSVTSP